MPISLPEDYKESLDNHQDRIKEIRANYNFLFQKKEKELKKKFGDEFDKIIKTNRAHAILLSDFLKPFISNKKNSKFKPLKNYTLLLLDPLYSEGLKKVPTFDALIGYTSESIIDEIYYIEAKSKTVDDEYKEYEKYFSKDLINIIKKKIKDQYPHLKISDKLGITIHLLVYDRYSTSWITSIKETKKNIYLWSRIDEKNAEKKFKLIWRPNNEDHKLQSIIDFFDRNLILTTTEFEMSYSLDNIYNLDILRKNYINRFKDVPVNFKLIMDIFKNIAKSDYFEKKTIENSFYDELIRLGLEYDVIHIKNLKGDMFFRKGDDLFKKKYLEKKMNDHLYQNEEIKKKILEKTLTTVPWNQFS